MPEANGEINTSNEFFKKLNQQIVQKDNLIKLLQLQIRNLKGQLESGEADTEKANELQTVLEQKNSELESLRSELEEQKKISETIGAEKDEQIRSLNEMLEKQNTAGSEYIESNKVAELEENLRKIQSDYQKTKSELDSLKEEKLQTNNEIAQLKNELQVSKKENEESERTISELNNKFDIERNELQNKNSELLVKSEELQSKNSELLVKSEELQDKNNELLVKSEELQNKNNELLVKSEELQNKNKDLLVKSEELINKNEELKTKSLELQNKSDELNNKNAELKIKIDELLASSDDLKHKNAELEASSKVNINKDEELQKAVNEANNKNQALISQITLEAETYKNQANELSIKLEEMQSSLAEKERNQLSFDEELKKANESLAEANNKIAELKNENENYNKIKEEINILQNEKEEFAKISAKLSEAEANADMLNNELEKVRSELVSQTKKEEYLLQISQLQQSIVDKDEVISSLRRDIENNKSTSNNEDIEALTHQIADQLITIQNIDKELRATRNNLAEKELEVSNLKIKLSESNEEKDLPPTSSNMDNDDIIASFIDFFDGLDTALSKKSDPELQALHRKLMDKLIVPNKISYMPVISEEFDTQKHIATDYFRSDRFPERCIVFEVEKGYIKDDRVIKKSKVWVVQNLFKCASCGAEQTNPDSRFCHLCGTKILAPNGLPIDSLPIFEPTAITYSRFSERMLEKGNLLKAKEYIQSGLELDSDYLPLILSMSDVLISESDFQGAIDYLKRAYNLKPDERIKAKIQNIETKLSIFSQAKNLKLSSDDIDKLLHIIQK